MLTFEDFKKSRYRDYLGQYNSFEKPGYFLLSGSPYKILSGDKTLYFVTYKDFEVPDEDYWEHRPSEDPRTGREYEGQKYTEYEDREQSGNFFKITTTPYKGKLDERFVFRGWDPTSEFKARLEKIFQGALRSADDHRKYKQGKIKYIPRGIYHGGQTNDIDGVWGGNFIDQNYSTGEYTIKLTPDAIPTKTIKRDVKPREVSQSRVEFLEDIYKEILRLSPAHDWVSVNSLVDNFSQELQQKYSDKFSKKGYSFTRDERMARVVRNLKKMGLIDTKSGPGTENSYRKELYVKPLRLLNNDDTDVHLPPLKNKDDLFLTAPKVTSKQKFTKPPSRFTNKTIVEELEKRKIGRPATIAPTIAKITNKNYVVVKLNSFVPTDNGKKVVDNLVNHFDFMKIEYTAEMESKLDQIAEGKLDYVKMLSSFYDPFKNELKKAYTENEKDYGHKCPKCNDKMLLKHGRFGFYMSCVKSPDCKGTLSCDMVDDKPVIRPWGGKIDDGIKCPTCSLSMMKTDGKWGEYYRCSDYKCKGTRKVPYGKKCPSCNGELYAAVYGEENVLFCMNYSDGCRHREPHPENNLKNPSKIIRDDIPKKIKKILK